MKHFYPNYFKNCQKSIENFFQCFNYKFLALFILLFIQNETFFGQGTTCATSTPLTINGACDAGTIGDTTQDLPLYTVCGGTFQREGWYTFTVTGGPLSVTITAIGNRNIAYQLMSSTSSCTGLAQISCINAQGGSGGSDSTETSTQNLSNGIYYVKVLNVGGNNDLNLTSICVTSSISPVNDLCSGATVITSNTICSTTTGSTTGATDNNETGDCTIGTESAVWYQFQAVATSHTVTVDGIASFDAVVQVLNTCGVAGNPTGGACVDVTAGDGIETLNLTGLTIGNFYKIQVHDFQGDLTANGFTICVTHSLPPTITSLGATSGCPGSSITINGTNLTGATAANVRIGGTPVTSITSNTGTVIVAVIGTGTTGTVSVTTGGGTATSGATFTVPVIAAIGGGGAAVCTGATTIAFTNATTGGVWSTSNANATINPLGVVTGVTAGAVNVVYTVSGCSVSRTITVNQTPVAITGGAASVCTGATTPAFINTTGGGAWSIVSGTGTATITGGGVVTGVTAGTVTVVYTRTGCTASTSLTINQSPAAIGGGAATVCTGASTIAFTNATAGGAWSTSNANATINASGVATGVTAGTVNITYTVSGCSRTTALTVINTISTLATIPSPANGATGVCYAGGGIVTDLTWTAAVGAVSYDVYFGTNPIPAFAANQTGVFYTLPTLLANTVYYWRIVPRSACGVSTGVPVTWSFTTNTIACYCPSAGLNNAFNDGITLVQFNTINNITSANAGNNYTDYTATQNTSVAQGATHTLNVNVNTDGNFTQNQMAWIDWNQNGIFTDAGESYNLGIVTNLANGLSSACPLNIVVPATASLGTTRMRVSSRYNAYANPCDTNYDGEVEDYSVTVTLGTCIGTPTAQPTALALTPVGQSINGTFTAAVPVANQYLVVISSSAVAPTPPVNGTVYNIGNTLGAGYTIVDNDSNTTFNAGALNLNTTYYFYIYSFNNFCVGSPLYLATSPLIGNATTPAVPAVYCTPVTTSAPIDRLYVNNIQFVGTLLDQTNTSTTDGTPDGFQDFTGNTKAIQAQGGAININLGANVRGFWKVWVDWNKDGDFVDVGEEMYNPTGSLFAYSTFGFVVPSTIPVGDYRIRFRVQNTYRNSDSAEFLVNFDTCNSFDPINISGTNYRTYGEAEDYLFTVIAKCDSNITSITNPPICGAISGTVNPILSATSTSGSINWYTALTGGAPIANTASGANWTSPATAISTTYYVTALGSCESLVRTPVFAEVKPVPALIIATPNVTVCGENSIIQLGATGNNEVAYLINENFELGTLGVFSSINSDATSNAVKARTAWKNKTSIFVPTGARWFPAVTSGFGTNKFALTSFDDLVGVTRPVVPMENSLTVTNNLNSTGYLSLTLSLRLFYSRYIPDGLNPTLENCKVEVSTDGGVAWTTLAGGNYTTDQGFGSNFVTVTFPMNAYINNTLLKIRIKALGNGTATGTSGDGVGIDDVKLFGDRALTPYFALGGGVDGFYDATATTTPYDGLPANTIYIRPTLTQLEQPSFVINVSSNLNNGCVTSGTINVTNNTNVWKGTTDNNWNTPSNWAPANVPTIASCVIIPISAPNPTFLNSGAAGNGKNLLVKNGGILEVQAGNSLTIKENVTIETGGAFTVENNSSLIQIDNVGNINNGTFIYERTAPLIKGSDYVYWSSPVANQAIGSLYSTPVPGPIYQWETTAINANSGLGTWVGASGNMLTGKGYIMRGSSNYGLAATNLDAVFSGTPNNGDLTIKAMRGDMEPANVGPSLAYPNPALNAWDDNWTLLGNPYPSAINALQFLSTNSTELEGNVRLWRHLSDPALIASPFYQTFVYNYNSGDYLTINFTGPTTPSASDIIKSGQAFLVQRREGTQDLTGIDVTFNNTMRLTPTSMVMSNSGFFRSSHANQNALLPTERHRIWLDIVNGTTNASETTLLGYVAGATTNFDSNYDATIGISTAIGIYSFADNQKCIIQGRPVPFIQEDTVPIGINVQTNGSYHIAIKAVDGLFEGTTQNIYLEDKLLNIVHDLKAIPYSFTSIAGTFNDRFVLKYTNATLSNEDFNVSNEIRIFANDKINIVSTNELIKEVVVYDILGKTLLNKKGLESKNVVISEMAKDSKMLIVKAILQNGKEVIKKVIY